MSGTNDENAQTKENPSEASAGAESPAALKKRIDDLESCLADVYRCLNHIHVTAERMSMRQDALQCKAEIERVGVSPPAEPGEPDEDDRLRDSDS
jgi:hypothetical protein